jgi:hypothetical protein
VDFRSALRLSPKFKAALTLFVVASLAVWFMAFVAVGYPWTMVGYFTDGLFYLLMADALTHGVSASGSETGATLLAIGRFPPGYALYLSLLGGDRTAEGMVMANLAQMLAVLALMLIAFGYYRRLAGRAFPALLGVIYVTVTGSIHPWALELSSEPLFMAMLLGLCWIATADHFPRRWLWMGVLLGLACLVRVMGVVLIPVLVLHIWYSSKDWRRALAAGSFAALPTLAWQCFQWLSGQTSETSYVSGFYDGLASLGGWWSTLPERILALHLAFAPYVFPVWAKLVFSTLLLVAVAPSAWSAFRRLEFPAWSALALIATLVAWPFPGHMDRLAGPIVPLLAGLLLAGTANAWRLPAFSRVSPRPSIVVAMAALAFAGHALSVAWLAGMPARVADPQLRAYQRSIVGHNRIDPQREFENYHQILTAAEMLSEFVPPTSCVDTTMPLLIRLRTNTHLRLLSAEDDLSHSPCEYLLAINARGEDSPPALFPLNDPDLPPHEILLLTKTSEGFSSAVLMRLR